MNILDQIKTIDIFKGIEKQEDFEALVKVIRQETYLPQQMIFEKGAIGDTMYIILKGAIRIFTRDEKDNELTIRFYRENDIFGELALLDEQPRSASADAVEASEILALSRADFLLFLEDRPSVGMAMIRNLSGRVRYTTNYLEKVLDSTHWLSQGEYDRAIQELAADSLEHNIQNLIANFIEMISSIRQREQSLRQEIKQLRIQIDERSRKAQVDEITSSGFFRNLHSQLQKRRQQNY